MPPRLHLVSGYHADYPVVAGDVMAGYSVVAIADAGHDAQPAYECSLQILKRERCTEEAPIVEALRPI